MTGEEIERLYCQEYAARYEEKFLTGPLAASDAEYEVEALRTELTPGAAWLDVGCGTGFHLRQIEGVHKGGIDRSAAMLEHARVGNPTAELVHGDFRQPREVWEGRWDVVSCLWYAYALVESLREVEAVLVNMAKWTHVGGTCLLSYADPSAIAGVQLPFVVERKWPGRIVITGITWEYEEPEEAKVHRGLLAPQGEWIREVLRMWFGKVETKPYSSSGPGLNRRELIRATERLPRRR